MQAHVPVIDCPLHREEIPLHAPVPLPLLSLLLLLALSALPLRVQAALPPLSPAPARQESSPSQATPVQAMAEPIRIGVLATRGPAWPEPSGNRCFAGWHCACPAIASCCIRWGLMSWPRPSPASTSISSSPTRASR